MMNRISSWPASRMRRIASSPSMPGILMSISTRSGRKLSAISSAVLPLTASPISRSGKPSLRIARKPWRSMGSSSTISSLNMGNPPFRLRKPEPDLRSRSGRAVDADHVVHPVKQPEPPDDVADPDPRGMALSFGEPLFHDFADLPLAHPDAVVLDVHRHPVAQVPDAKRHRAAFFGRFHGVDDGVFHDGPRRKSRD